MKHVWPKSEINKSMESGNFSANLSYSFSPASRLCLCIFFISKHKNRKNSFSHKDYFRACESVVEIDGEVDR